jgi:hypothetical protein
LITVLKKTRLRRTKLEISTDKLAPVKSARESTILELNEKPIEEGYDHEALTEAKATNIP